MINQNLNKGLIAWFVNNPVAANLLFWVVIIAGLLSVTNLRKEAFPSLEPDTVSVSVVFDSGEPIQAEQGIAIKIENALQSVSGIKRMTSTSNAQGAHVSVEMQSGYDIDSLYQDIKSKIDAINNLPQRSEPAVITKATRKDHVLWLQLYGDLDRQTLDTWALRLKDALLEKHAIKELEVKARAQWEISIEVDEAKLQAYQISLDDIAQAINRESSYAIGTSLYNPDKTVRLKVSEQAYNTEQFESIVIKSFSKGGNLRLKDIANVQYKQADDTFTLSRYNGFNAAAIEIVMDEHSDVVEIVEQANTVVKQWQHLPNLPKGMKIASWLDKSTLITERLSLLIKNALTGIALVFIVLALFLNVRVALWVAMGLPFVFCGTLFFMTERFTGLSLNEMTTFGFIMALGIVVDDAVVIGESIYHTRAKNGDNVLNTILGTHKVATATLFGVLTTVVAFIALSNVQGRLGQVYAQFGTIVAIALLLSLVESKLILPSHLAHLDTSPPKKRGIWAIVRLHADRLLNSFNERVYTVLLCYVVNHYVRIISLFLVIMILVMSLPFTGAVRSAFFPDVPADTVSAEITMYNDASYGQIYKNLLKLEQLALQTDNQLSAQYRDESKHSEQSHISSIQVLSDSSSQGTVTIELDKDAVYQANEFAQLWTQLSGQLEGAKKTKILAKRGMIDNFKVQLKSNNDQALKSAGAFLLRQIQEINGTSGIDHNLDLGEPQYYFELNEQGRALGLDTNSLSMQVLNSFGGDIVQRFQQGENEIKVRVRYPQQQRKTLADIKAAYVRTPSGIIVPLSDIAHVHSQYQSSEITRIQGKRAVFISAVVDKEVISPHQLIAQLKASTLGELEAIYPDVSINFAGEAQQQQETGNSMVQMFALAMLIIYALLAIPLKSYIQPVIIMAAIPFGVVGAILGHWLNGLTLSILSLNGILALSGVVVNDSLLLVSRYNQLMSTGQFSVKEAAIIAGSSRLRAVVLTSITTFAGLLPLLSETSLQAQFLIPAAAALGYGILFASLITLLLTPALLLMQQDVNMQINKGARSLQAYLQRFKSQKSKVQQESQGGT
ncbi:acriflavin resistance protein [Pseudoalteromonas sp. A25]|uniref:efflux RND transporter permease subunit n=1 Tax=Pseudoalteromonas sp. A25 TaxID=116092 RepID=UPI00126050A4|nr:efflux RND transporter permease subunit [Pseudoalteromonas sp. A25]BBN81703.1 acriflavin resistance protein [Pseudoalteromonas sp. A25]